MKRFNYTGTCIPNRHYMVTITEKLDKIKKHIDYGEYFTINRPRQYGKTTTLFLLKQRLKQDYIIIKTSFEGIGEIFFQTEENFCKSILSMFADRIVSDYEDFKQIVCSEDKGLTSFKELSKAITNITKNARKKVILIIDEVDKATNYSLFYNFLGLLRNKYLKQNEGDDSSFHSVILAGVHDIKSIKMKIRDNKESEYNSPWNIAVDFKVDMSFSVDEIYSMLADYEKNNKTGMDIDLMAIMLREYTSGYPYLVSKLCYIMDEELEQSFNENSFEHAMRILLNEKNTLFDDLIKNINKHGYLFELLKILILNGKSITFNSDVHSLGVMYGILKEDKAHKLRMDNKIFEIRIYNYLIALQELKKGIAFEYKYKTKFIDDKGDLDLELILTKFQELMKTEYRQVDEKFVEREGRLLFLSFITPIINGFGFYFVEPETRESNRMDIVVTFNYKKFVIELKIWRGEKYAQEGRMQLCNYLEYQNLEKGYMVFFNFNKNKKYECSDIVVNNKNIFEITV